MCGRYWSGSSDRLFNLRRSQPSVSHSGVDGGHANEYSFLNSVPHPAGGRFRNTISLDQYAADCVGAQTRFRSLVLGISGGGGGRMSYTSSGVLIPSEGTLRRLSVTRRSRGTKL